jgi:hypothetical protein
VSGGRVGGGDITRGGFCGAAVNPEMLIDRQPSERVAHAGHFGDERNSDHSGRPHACDLVEHREDAVVQSGTPSLTSTTM